MYGIRRSEDSSMNIRTQSRGVSESATLIAAVLRVAAYLRKDASDVGSQALGDDCKSYGSIQKIHCAQKS